MARRVRLASLALILAVLVTQGAAAGPKTVHGLGVPRGYRVSYARLGHGVDLFTFVAPHRRFVRVVRLEKGAPYELRPLLSQGRLAGPRPRLERTSDMCKRAHCLAAVNGDFFSAAGMPAGGMIAAGEPVRSDPDRPHLLVGRDGVPHLRTGLRMTGKLIVTYPKRVEGIRLPLEDVKEYNLAGVNARRGPDGIMAFTARHGPTTETPKTGTEMRLALPDGRTFASVEQAARIMSSRRGRNTVIPRDGVVLSATGNGAKLLDRIWRDVRSEAALPDVKLSLSTPGGAVEGIAGKPILLYGGKDAYPNSRSWFVRGYNPRTMVGWTRAGDILLVTVDGRRPSHSAGMGLAEAAGFMRALGAVDALNLDGGGSTTLTVRGRVVNRPSDRGVVRHGRARVVPYPARGDRLVAGSVERPVASALAIVAKG